MLVATPPAPPAIVHHVSTTTTRQRVTPVAPIAVPMFVPAYRAKAQAQGWPFTTTTTDANAVARAVLAAARADGARSVTRVYVSQARNRSNVTWWITTNARTRDGAWFEMRVTLNRQGRGMLATRAVAPVVCCTADPSRATVAGPAFVASLAAPRMRGKLVPRKRSW